MRPHAALDTHLVSENATAAIGADQRPPGVRAPSWCLCHRGLKEMAAPLALHTCCDDGCDIAPERNAEQRSSQGQNHLFVRAHLKIVRIRSH